jgi:hypothetical protein
LYQEKSGNPGKNNLGRDASFVFFFSSRVSAQQHQFNFYGTAEPQRNGGFGRQK